MQPTRSRSGWQEMKRPELSAAWKWDSIPGMFKRLVDYVRGLVQSLLSLRDGPHAVAGGVACGIFIGFTPLFGAKTILSLAIAWISRCSKLAAVIAVSLTDLLTPFWPVIWRFQYDIGYWLLSHPHRFPPALDMHAIKLADIFQWSIFKEVGLPLFVGSLCLAVPLAALAYGMTFLALRNRLKKPLGPAA